MTLGAPTFAADEALAVKNVSVNGGIVLVTVKNVSVAPASSTVAVEAVVNDTAVWSLVPIVLMPGQSTTVSAAFTGAVSNVKSVGFSVGVVDEGTPF
jgi:hypothetical protein